MVHTLIMRHIKVDMDMDMGMIWKDVYAILLKKIGQHIYNLTLIFKKTIYMECMYRQRLRIYINYKR